MAQFKPSKNDFKRQQMKQAVPYVVKLLNIKPVLKWPTFKHFKHVIICGFKKDTHEYTYHIVALERFFWFSIDLFGTYPNW